MQTLGATITLMQLENQTLHQDIEDGNRKP